MTFFRLSEGLLKLPLIDPMISSKSVKTTLSTAGARLSKSKRAKKEKLITRLILTKSSLKKIRSCKRPLKKS